MLSLSLIAAAAIRTAYDFSARDGAMWICGGKSDPFPTACKWPKCAGCAECAAAALPPPPPPDAGPCYDWCPNTISSCKWKKCTGCPACG